MREVVAWKDKKGDLHKSKQEAAEEDLYYELRSVIETLAKDTFAEDDCPGFHHTAARIIARGRKEILKVLIMK